MNSRMLVVLAAAAGLTAQVRGQEMIQVSYTWSEVIGGTLTPVASPNSVLEPGEGARIGINLFAMKNGIDAIGQTTTYIAPPGPGTGTIRGIASLFCTVIGDSGQATAAGSWNDRAFSPALPDGNFAGTVQQNGAMVYSLGGFQSVPTGQTGNASNPIQEAFRGVWTPSGYSPRVVFFRAVSATQFDQDCSVLIQYGSGFVDPMDPTTEYPLYFSKFVHTDFGGWINIPIAPGPGCGVVLAGAAALHARRRRRG